MVVANTTVDIPALKARHPLGGQGVESHLSSGAAPAAPSPSTKTTRALRPPSGLRACLDGGLPSSSFHRGVSDVGGLAALPNGQAASL